MCTITCVNLEFAFEIRIWYSLPWEFDRWSMLIQYTFSQHIWSTPQWYLCWSVEWISPEMCLGFNFWSFTELKTRMNWNRPIQNFKSRTLYVAALYETGRKVGKLDYANDCKYCIEGFLHHSRLNFQIQKREKLLKIRF